MNRNSSLLFLKKKYRMNAKNKEYENDKKNLMKSTKRNKRTKTGTILLIENSKNEWKKFIHSFVVYDSRTLNKIA